MKFFLLNIAVIIYAQGLSQNNQTIFEKSTGLETATYASPDAIYNTISIKKFDTTDAG